MEPVQTTRVLTKSRQLGPTRLATEAPARVSVEDAVRFALEHPFEAPPTMAHAANARMAEPIMRGLARKPGVIERIRAARSADEVRRIQSEHLGHATPKIARRWAEAGERRIGELRAGALA